MHFIDDEDSHLLSEFNWYISSAGYLVRGKYLKTILLHRVISGAKKNEYVDHINGNKLDNRRSNLRLCTQSQNLCNQRLRSDSSTKVKGVSWNKFSKKFEAYINVNKKRIYLGLFPTLELAKIARHEASIKYHGEFCAL